jgi:hypothetical protein
MSANGVCFDIGNRTNTSIVEFKRTNEPYRAEPRSDGGQGNGSLMRLTPVPLFFSNHPQWAIEFAGDSSRTTHPHRGCRDACRYMAGLIVGALQGASKEQLLQPFFTPEGVPGDYWQLEGRELLPTVDEIAAGSFLHKSPPEIRGSGYVVHTLESVLWAFANSTSFQEGALLVANLGDDADTTCCIYGQLAGAYYGLGAIPDSWRRRTVFSEAFEALGAMFDVYASSLQLVGGENDGSVYDASLPLFEDVLSLNTDAELASDNSFFYFFEMMEDLVSTAFPYQTLFEHNPDRFEPFFEEKAGEVSATWLSFRRDRGYEEEESKDRHAQCADLLFQLLIGSEQVEFGDETAGLADAMWIEQQQHALQSLLEPFEETLQACFPDASHDSACLANHRYVSTVLYYGRRFRKKKGMLVRRKKRTFKLFG